MRVYRCKESIKKDKDGIRDKIVMAAAFLVEDPNLSCRQAMLNAGFAPELAKDRSMQKRVSRYKTVHLDNTAKSDDSDDDNNDQAGTTPSKRKRTATASLKEDPKTNSRAQATKKKRSVTTTTTATTTTTPPKKSKVVAPPATASPQKWKRMRLNEREETVVLVDDDDRKQQTARATKKNSTTTAITPMDKERVKQAAKLMVDIPALTRRQAMLQAGFSIDDAKNRSIQQRVSRYLKSHYGVDCSIETVSPSKPTTVPLNQEETVGDSSARAGNTDTAATPPSRRVPLPSCRAIFTEPVAPKTGLAARKATLASSSKNLDKAVAKARQQAKHKTSTRNTTAQTISPRRPPPVATKRTNPRRRLSVKEKYAGYANVCGPWPSPPPAAAAAVAVGEGQPTATPTSTTTAQTREGAENVEPNAARPLQRSPQQTQEEQQQHLPKVLLTTEPVDKSMINRSNTKYHVGRLPIKAVMMHAYNLHCSIQALETYCLTALVQAQQSTTTNENNNDKEGCEFAEQALRAVINVQKLQRDAILNYDEEKMAPFEVFLRDVVQYKMKHGHANIWENNLQNSKINNQAKRCRRWYRVHMEEEAKLKSSDETVRAEQHALWNSQKHGHDYVECRNEFLQENVPILAKLGFVWKNPNEPRSIQWGIMFQHLKDFHAREGHSMVPQYYCTQDGKPLGRWVNQQRKEYAVRQAGGTKNGKRSSSLTDDRLQQLESIGFVWKLRPGPPTKGDPRYVAYCHHTLGISNPWDPSTDYPPPAPAAGEEFDYSHLV